MEKEKICRASNPYFKSPLTKSDSKARKGDIILSPFFAAGGSSAAIPAQLRDPLFPPQLTFQKKSGEEMLGLSKDVISPRFFLFLSGSRVEKTLVLAPPPPFFPANVKDA